MLPPMNNFPNLISTQYIYGSTLMGFIKLPHYDVSIKTKSEAPQLSVSQPTLSSGPIQALGKTLVSSCEWEGGRASVTTKEEEVWGHRSF